MIVLYYDLTPNGRKIHMALEELGLDYSVQWIDVKAGRQFEPEFTRINPNAKIPAIVDEDGPGGAPIALFESGAILTYLADKTGRLLPEDLRSRWEATCWVYWQVANQGPACGNAAHFTQYAPAAGVESDYSKNRFVTEARRCCAVLDERLRNHDYLAGDSFSIADIACFPWTRVLKAYGIAIDDYPALAAWSAAISKRPSARAKVTPPDADAGPPKNLSEEDYIRLFGTAPTTSTSDRHTGTGTGTHFIEQ